MPILDSDTLISFVTRLRTQAAGLQDDARALATALDALDWSGTAAEAFQAEARGVQARLVGDADALTTCADTLDDHVRAAQARLHAAEKYLADAAKDAAKAGAKVAEDVWDVLF